MKKLSMLLSLVMLTLTFGAVTPSIVLAEEMSEAADFFDADANLSLYENDGMVSKTIDSENERGNVIYAETAATTKSIGKAVCNDGINKGKVLFGLDVKIEKDIKNTRINFAIKTKKADGGASSYFMSWIEEQTRVMFMSGAGLASLGTQWDSGTTPSGDKAESAVKKSIEKEKWFRVDNVIDYDNKTRYLYVNGELVDSRTKDQDSSEFYPIYDEKITGFSVTERNTINDSVAGAKDDCYFDNIRFASIPSKSSTTIKTDGNDVYLYFNTACGKDLTELSRNDIKIENTMDRTKTINIKSIMPIDKSGVKITTTDLNDAQTGEYQVVVNREIHDIFGNLMTTGCFNKIKDAVSFTMLDKNFEDGNPGTDKATVVDDTDASGNKALSITKGTLGVDYSFTSEYNQQNNSIENKVITTSYRLKLASIDKTGDNNLRVFETFSSNPDAAREMENYTTGMYLGGNNEIKILTYDKYTDKNQFESDSPGKPREINMELDKWYTFSRVCSYGTNNKKGSVHVLVKDDAGNSIYDIVTGISYEKGLHDKPYYISAFRINNGIGTILVDDIKIEQSYTLPEVASVRFVDVNGVKHVPNRTLPNDINKIEINMNGSGLSQENFNDKVMFGGVTRTGTFDVNTNTYTIDLGGILTPATDYTLSIGSIKGTDEYVTSFESSDGSFKITNVKIVDKSGNEIALNDVTPETELKVVVEGINTTAFEQSVAVSYGIFNNKMLTGFNFKNFDFEANGQKIICDYPIGPVENISGLEIKGFVWDNMSNMIPQCGFVELKPTAQE